MSLLKIIESDFRKYKKYGGNFFAIVFFTQGFWAVFQFRIASGVYKNVKVPILRQILLFFCLLWQKLVEITTGISIPASSKIGDSFYIGHFGGIILNSKTIIGNNCNISQGVTIGVSGQGENRGVPIIKDNVYIGANSVVAGNIVVGNNALIGACSLINNDVEDNSVMVGVPAVKISEKGSKGYI
ncbi:serine O-acetyltransferase [Flavobacterium sp. H122]|uniref:serine O-acetyltransferase n=1 Tax=Flavobacterium sp. H122 TaxID=2529860 RepID=UPI0010AA9EA2|nr:serine acetyltransferase [Flavobacterium sp. H122]